MPNFICTTCGTQYADSEQAVERIVRAVELYPFDRIYSDFWDMVIPQNGKAVGKDSAERYLKAIEQ